MISIIVAIDEKRGIGKNNDLLFKIPRDFKRMSVLTSGHPIIMGRKTHESIGRVLPKRTNIIITRDTSYRVEGATVVDSLEKAIEVTKKSDEEKLLNTKYQILNTDENEIFIFGGGQIFTESIEKGMVDKLYLTIVKGDYHADTFFPAYEHQFPVIESEESYDEDGYTFTFQNRLQNTK